MIKGVNYRFRAVVVNCPEEIGLSLRSSQATGFKNAAVFEASADFECQRRWLLSI